MHKPHFVKLISALRQTVEDMIPLTFHDTILRLFINDGKDSDIKIKARLTCQCRYKFTIKTTQPAISCLHVS